MAKSADKQINKQTNKSHFKKLDRVIFVQLIFRDLFLFKYKNKNKETNNKTKKKEKNYDDCGNDNKERQTDNRASRS